MIEDIKLNIYYKNKYPFICKAVYNIYKNSCKKKNLNIKNSVEEIKFIKDENIEEIKIEFLSSNNEHPNSSNVKYIFSTDKIFSKNLDYILNTNLYYISNNINDYNILNVYIQTQYDEWIDFFRYKNIQKDITNICEHINKHLLLNTFISSNFLTLSDLYVFYEMYKYFNTASLSYTKYSKQYKNINRWFKLVNSILGDKDDELQNHLKAYGAVKEIDECKINTKHGTKQKVISTSYEGKLENAENGKVVTRFPPEPSGYLHIGHAKAAFLNSYYANMYNGKMLLRFDDTNPALEDIKYENSIIEDLQTLGLKYEQVSYTSDYFDLLQDYCEKLIKMDKAYADDTNLEEMRYQRGEGINSIRRDNTIEKNLEIFEEMKKGTEIGKKYCIRAKIDMKNKNKCMRDPVMYRCVVDIPHHRHQFKYKCYPTYDFACPIIDSIEGVTHALRTNEYSDRIEQYNWVLSTLELRKVYIYEFSRISFVRTVMSKRKLKWFVENKVVDSWNDPRMPTIKGILRRGLTKEALFQFILEQGPSKSGNLMQWDKLWSINKQIIDPIIPRYAAVDKKKGVILTLTDMGDEIIEKERDLHMKNKELGTCKMYVSKKIIIELEDAITLNEKEEITLIKLGNVIVNKIIKNGDNISEIMAVSNLSGDYKTTKKKIHWLPFIPEKLVTCTLYEYDHLITTDKFESDDKNDWKTFINYDSKFQTTVYADPAIVSLKISDKLQFERRGYFIVDRILKDQIDLIKIPDGKSKNMSIISTKVDPKSLAGTKNKDINNSEKKKKMK